MLQNEIGDIEQCCACRAVSHPGACVATQPVVDREAGAQQRYVQAFGTLCGMCAANDQLRLFCPRGTFQVLKVADMDLAAGKVSQHA